MKNSIIRVNIILLFFLFNSTLFSQIKQQWISKYGHKSSSEDIINFMEIDNFRNIYVAGKSGIKFFVAKYNQYGSQLWSSFYSNTQDEDDFLAGLKVDVMGNVYITGSVLGSDTTYDIITIKYNSSGVQQWVARYTSLRNDDIAAGIGVDSRSNVYITGYQYNSTSRNDIILIKYNSSGIQQWMRRENGIGNDDDYPSAIAIDANNNIFVVGESSNPWSFIDFITIKFDSTGLTHWKSYYDGISMDEDIPVAIGLDNFNNIYVLGSSYGDTTDLDYVVVKYNQSGSLQWVGRYNSPSNMEDVPTAMKVTLAGSVYATGYCFDFMSSYNILTVKFNNSGNVEWGVQYDGGAGLDDYGYGIATDASENVYVTGTVTTISGLYEIHTIKYDAFGTKKFNIKYTLSSEFPTEAVSLRLDNQGGLIITGFGFTIANANDGIILKYNTSGNLLWSAILNFFEDESLEDLPYNISVDNVGNLYIVGTSYDNGTMYDYITIKLSSNGETLWTARYDGAFHDNDEAYDVAVDKFKNVYVTGRSFANSYNDDIVTIKYNESGTVQWIKSFDGPTSKNDIPVGLVIDSLTNIIIAGYTYNSNNNFDIVTIKYNSSGDRLWVNYFNSPSNLDDYPTAIKSDKVGNIYIAGQVTNTQGFYDAVIIKINPNGVQEWVKYYSGTVNGNYNPSSIAIDTSGDVIVAISAPTLAASTDIIVIKYNSSGNVVWIQQYNGTSNGMDYPKKIVSIPSRDIYVGGWTENGSNYTDMLVLKYSSSGVKLWEAKYNGVYNDYDFLEDMFVDQWGNVYISGTIENPNGKNNFATIKYNTSGTQQWVAYYQNSFKNSSEVTTIAMDNLGNIFVTGIEYDSLDNADIITVMYRQETYITGKVFFDTNNNGTYDSTDLPLSGWKVLLSGTKKDSTITDSSGIFTFKNIPFGNYTITQVVKPGWVQTLPASNYSISINSGNLSGVFNFGNYSSTAIAFPVDGKWNLMSLPIRVADRRKNTVFGSAVSNAFAFESGYVARDTLSYMEGYWLKFLYPHIVWIAGGRFEEDSVDVKLGWNLIGTISYPIPVSTVQSVPPNIISSAFYGYKNGYQMSDSLRPSQGYWVKVRQNGKLKFRKNTIGKIQTLNLNSLSDIWKISINDSEGNSQNLYFTTTNFDESIIEYFAAPPIPPNSAFDVRFITNSYLYDHSKMVKTKIVIRGATYPIKIEWSSTPILKYELSDELGNFIGTLEGKRGTITINNLNLNTLWLKPVISDEIKSIPKNYALHQNYPNPFNSSTLIKYELPTKDFVSIKVYNTLGKEIASLVNETQEEGFYSVTFDASEYPSGVYFCKFTTTKFSAVKKLLLIK